jgi:hypothetical protein
MPEVSREVKVFAVSYQCDICGEDMICYSVLTSMPEIYQYSCFNGHEMNDHKQYPRTEYRKV